VKTLAENTVGAPELNARGVALHQQRDLVGARLHYAAAIEADPDCASALANLCALMLDLELFDAAVVAASRAVRIKPDSMSYAENLGNALWRSDRYEEAIAELRRSVTMTDTFGARHNLGLCYIALSRFDEGIAELKRAAHLIKHSRTPVPDRCRIDVRADLSFALLGSGRLEEGFTANEDRWDRLAPHPVQRCGLPAWDGKNPAGKTIIVHHEQGFGDTLQFCRYLPMLRDAGAYVVFAGPSDLMGVIEASGLADQVLDHDKMMPRADYRCALMSLPHFFGTKLGTIPPSGYLRAPFGKIKVERRPGTKVAVGMVWATNRIELGAQKRCVGLPNLLRLAEAPGVELFSLQFGAGRADINRYGAESLVTDLGARFTSFSDTADAIAQLDAVVSVDTSVLHLAAGMGKPTLCAFPFSNCWRWMGRGKARSPWYDSARLFWQDKPGNWTPVVDGIAKEVATLCR
jgi:hypothetical protein